MPFYPQTTSDYEYISYPVGPISSGAVITSNAAINTKGAYVELAASTPFACNQIQLSAIQTAAVNGRGYLLDIAVGAAGAEVDVLPNVPFEGFGGSSLRAGGCITLPLSIPAGSRVSARVQSNVGASVININVMLARFGTIPAPTSYTAIGASLATSRGTALDPGTVVNTKGAYTQLIASTAAVIQIMAIVINTNGNTDPTSTWWYVDIATGAAAAEVVKIPDISFNIGESSSLPSRPFNSRTLFPYIPAGSRIALRMSSSVGAAIDRLSDFVLLVATAPAESSGGGGASSRAYA